jgi:hypothetical protein
LAFEESALEEAGDGGVGDAGAALGSPVLVDLGGGGLAVTTDEVEDGLFAGLGELLVAAAGSFTFGDGR